MAAAGMVANGRAADFETFIKPLLAQQCVKCHGGEEVSAKVDFKQLATAAHLLENPELIKRMIDAIDANDMPPEGEPRLDATSRQRLLNALRAMLRDAVAAEQDQQVSIRRLNRFQYNNSVKDLFQLKRDVFPLPERLMTRRDNYLVAGTDRMPEQVHVVSESLEPRAGLQDVEAFPKDLRAASGFDNQANQLTLSPLLLDTFLRLSVSILESPDFHEQNVGIWNDFFQPPAGAFDRQAELNRRLLPFLRIAFRGPVEDETLDRYAAYAATRLEQGLPFTAAMKKVASAVLSSPRFLYRSASPEKDDDQFELAANLSFFLWSSCPDQELLRLAESGELSRPEILEKTVERMLADPKMERFLDTFPTQWMQLENVLAATPDPQKNRYFNLDPDHPASLQMVLEPLLLFDAVFVENRPIVELIQPRFAYRSDFLQTWYNSDLKPPLPDTSQVVDANRRAADRRQQLEASIQATQAELDALLQPVRAAILAARHNPAKPTAPVDLKPVAAWEFNGDLNDSIQSLDLKAHGPIEFRDGMVVLEKAYLLSKKLPFDLQAKTLEVWCVVHDLDQRGGGVMGIQGPGDFFDTIVLGERQPRHWISGSNRFSRTLDFPDSTAEVKSEEMLHLVMVYERDGTTTLYRDGEPYGKPYQKGAATFPKDKTSVIFGLRHLPPGGNKFLSVGIDKARLYDRALTAAEVSASAESGALYVSEPELTQALSAEQKAARDALNQRLEQSRAALASVPTPQDPEKIIADAERRFDEQLRTQMRSSLFRRVPVSDPRYGGVITNAAVMSMTSGPQRTHPIARGAWVIEVILNDPPPPPPNNVPPLNEDAAAKELTIREQFAAHRDNPSCAGCHAKLDPLGFALENFDITGRWRDKYENGRDVDASGTFIRKYDFDGVVQFKESLVQERQRFAKAFTAHLLRFALSRELGPADALTIDEIVRTTENDNFRLQSLIREIVFSDRFLPGKQ